MKKFSKFSKRLLKKESGQGATEYILLLVVAVALVVMFKGKIQETMNGKIDELSGMINEVTGN